MTFFESLIALLFVAIALLQVARRVGVPYPTMLAGAGVLLGAIPGTPVIAIEPQTALALFIAPVLVDAAFDFPVNAVRRLLRPLIALAVVAVLLTAGTVAGLGVLLAGMPIYAALALGAIVAPPDAAAATAILGTVSMPRRSVAVLKGESLLNDATALLLFTAATDFPRHGDTLDGSLALELAIAAPGGILLGILLAIAVRRVLPFVTNTLGANLLEFATCFGAWIVAERLGLSAVLCLVAFAMTLARSISLTTPPRMRIQSFAVWTAAVFLLNVLAFLLMGLQARTIIGGMSPSRLNEAAWFALAVVLAVILVRLVWVMIYNRLAARFRPLRGQISAVSLRHGILVGWCGMRGIVTLAASFALPADFPQRDLIVLTAFAVVIATLVVQGLTLPALVRALRLDGADGLAEEMDAARADLAAAALATLDGKAGPSVDHWRYGFGLARAAALDPAAEGALDEKRAIGLAAIHRQRERLEELRGNGTVGADAFLLLQEDLDFAEVAVTSEADRQIAEE